MKSIYYNYIYTNLSYNLSTISKMIVDNFKKAILKEDFSEMETICSNEDNLKIISPEVSRIFNSAFEINNIKIVRWLLTSKLSSNIELDQNLLYTQYQNNNFEIIKIYLEYNPKCDISIILKQSLCQGNIKILKVFIKYNPEFFKQIIEKENQKMIEEYGDTYEIEEIRNNIFTNYCRNGEFEIIKLIYENYPEVIKYNWAFVFACEFGHIQLAKWLFEKRQEYSKEYPMYIWEFAFMWSCKSGKLDVIKWIYSINPDININADCGSVDEEFNDEGINGFTMACLEGNLDIAKWIFEIDSVKT